MQELIDADTIDKAEVRLNGTKIPRKRWFNTKISSGDTVLLTLPREQDDDAYGWADEKDEDEPEIISAITGKRDPMRKAVKDYWETYSRMRDEEDPDEKPRKKTTGKKKRSISVPKDTEKKIASEPPKKRSISIPQEVLEEVKDDNHKVDSRPDSQVEVHDNQQPSDATD